MLFLALNIMSCAYKNHSSAYLAATEFVQQLPADLIILPVDNDLLVEHPDTELEFDMTKSDPGAREDHRQVCWTGGYISDIEMTFVDLQTDVSALLHAPRGIAFCARASVRCSALFRALSRPVPATMQLGVTNDLIHDSDLVFVDLQKVVNALLHLPCTLARCLLVPVRRSVPLHALLRMPLSSLRPRRPDLACLKGVSVGKKKSSLLGRRPQALVRRPGPLRALLRLLPASTRLRRPILAGLQSVSVGKKKSFPLGRRPQCLFAHLYVLSSQLLAFRLLTDSEASTNTEADGSLQSQLLCSVRSLLAKQHRADTCETLPLAMRRASISSHSVMLSLHQRMAVMSVGAQAGVLVKVTHSASCFTNYRTCDSESLRRFRILVHCNQIPESVHIACPPLTHLTCQWMEQVVCITRYGMITRRPTSSDCITDSICSLGSSDYRLPCCKTTTLLRSCSTTLLICHVPPQCPYPAGGSWRRSYPTLEGAPQDASRAQVWWGRWAEQQKKWTKAKSTGRLRMPEWLCSYCCTATFLQGDRARSSCRRCGAKTGWLHASERAFPNWRDAPRPVQDLVEEYLRLSDFTAKQGEGTKSQPTDQDGETKPQDKEPLRATPKNLKPAGTKADPEPGDQSSTEEADESSPCWSPTTGDEAMKERKQSQGRSPSKPRAELRSRSPAKERGKSKARPKSPTTTSKKAASKQHPPAQDPKQKKRHAPSSDGSWEAVSDGPSVAGTEKERQAAAAAVAKEPKKPAPQPKPAPRTEKEKAVDRTRRKLATAKQELQAAEEAVEATKKVQRSVADKLRVRKEEVTAKAEAVERLEATLLCEWKALYQNSPLEQSVPRHVVEWLQSTATQSKGQEKPKSQSSSAAGLRSWHASSDNQCQPG